MVCLLFLGLGSLPGATAVPEHDDEIYTWRYEPEGGVQGTDCRVISPQQDNEDTPCRAISYEMGNTDTHMFFRWTMATFDFGPLAPVLNSGVTPPAVMLKQGFAGSADDGNRFDIDIRLEDEGTVSIDDAGRVAEAWHDEGLIELESDPDATTVTMAIPLEALAQTLKEGSVVGEEFRHAAPPEVEVTTNPLFEQWSDAQGFPSGMKNYSLSWYGDFVPETTEVSGELENNTLELSFDNHTWETHTYTWELTETTFLSEYQADVENGTLTLKIMDPNGTPVVDLDTTKTLQAVDNTHEEVEPGDWTIEVGLERFVGSITLILDPIPEETPDGQPDEEKSDDTDGDGAEPGDVENEESPAPALVITLAAALLAVVGLRRRRTGS